MTTSTLGIAVQSNAGTAAVDLDKLTASSMKAEAAAKRVGTAYKNAGSVMAQINQTTGAGKSPFGPDRASDIAAYGAELDRMRAKFNPIFAAQQRFATATEEITRAQRLGAISASEAANAINREQMALSSATAALEQNTSAANQNKAALLARKATGQNNFNTANVAAQFQDIAVTSAMGMSPLQIALQQGTQLSAVLGGQGLTGVVRTLGSAFSSILSPVSLVTLGVVALGSFGIQAIMGMMNSTDDATSSLENHSKWLDTVLAGYDDAREAAQGYLDNALKLPQGATKLELESGLTSALTALDERMSSVIEKQGRLARGDNSGMAPFILQVQSWQQQLSNGSLTLDDLIVKLKRVELDPSAESRVRSFATSMLDAAMEAQKADAQVKSIGASLGALANMSPIVIAINVATQGATDAIDRLKASEIDLRSLPEKYADDLSAAMSAPDKIMREAAQQQYDKNISAFNEQERRAAALKAARSASSAGAKTIDQWGSATDNFRQRIEQQQMEISLLGQSTFEAERQRAAFDLLNQAKSAGIPITATVTEQINAMSTEYATATSHLAMMTQAANDNNAVWAAAQDGVSGIIKTWARGGDVLAGISDKLLNIADMLVDMAVRDLFGAAFSGSSGGKGGGGGGIFGWLGSLFGMPSFAGGGSTGSGSRTGGIDGMGGFPAILHPNETVVDHTKGQSSGSQAVAVHVTVGVATDGNGNITPFVQKVARSEAQQASASMGGVVLQQANKSAPSAIAKYQRDEAGGDYRLG